LPLNKCLGVFLFVCFYWWGYTRVWTQFLKLSR
jgi:hypothetical protein